MNRAPAASVSPPASLLLVHGAGSGPWVFHGWASAFPGIDVVAIDLQKSLDIRRAGMGDYVAAVAARLRQPAVLCGWSMGGLVVLQAAPAVNRHSVILLEPNPPAEIQGFYPDVALHEGTFGPEEAYGRFPPPPKHHGLNRCSPGRSASKVFHPRDSKPLARDLRQEFSGGAGPADRCAIRV